VPKLRCSDLVAGRTLEKQLRDRIDGFVLIP
jgi:hypothetical protein